MSLAPHHFQAQRRHADDALALALELLVPYAWGVAGLAVDGDALRNGTFALLHARGLLPDGTPFELPESDAAPAPRDLRPLFSPTRESHVVHLALPAWRLGGANVALPSESPDADGRRWDDAPAGARPRFRALDRAVADETIGGDARALRFAAKAFRLALDDELAAGEVTLPLARVRRDGAGAFVLDPAFVPPCLSIDASPRLTMLARRVADMLDAKAAALAAQRSFAPGPAASGQASGYAGSELATLWLLHAVRSAEAPLRHLLATRRAHPERLWLELARLAGALCTFALDAAPCDLPVYTHDDLGACFGALERHLRDRLEVAVSSSTVVVPLAPAADSLHLGAVSDPRCFAPGARWFLAVRSSAGPVATAEGVPRLAKLCASKFVLDLVRRAFHGLTLEHLSAPPAAIAPRPDLQYFAVQQAGPCWDALQQSREVGVYVPDSLPDAVLELVVLIAE